MAYCCVPHCRSDGKQRIPGVSFHEIPAGETARQQWIKAIRRDDWVPNTTSNYSRVCSKHFRETDFAEGKRRRLKNGVIPTQQTPTISAKLPEEAVHVLERLKRTNVPARLPTLQLSAVVYVGGYIARVVMEHMDCEDCCAVTTKALSNQPLQQFVRHQDRGGLLYPSDKLLYVLETLRQFVETALQREPRLQKPLKTLLEAAVPAVSNSALLKCTTSDSQHHNDLAVLVCTRFIRPLLVNYASTTTDIKHFSRSRYHENM
ncbi:uncharacterized protein LOC125756747 [Rhipicephalus sanguineus]|uniref:uncharacterized protein LOC125756747 n=1 Tax=Rhipicephalus sanguineus TaxID=34632 RepID=UPI0020C44175|nr:uncharacterized protein LOC125756747 [Rhipicephalus sanguineus]